jgi:hypothetical protein
MTSRSTWRRCVVEDHPCSNNLPKQLKKLDGPAQGVKRTVKDAQIGDRLYSKYRRYTASRFPLSSIP